MSCQKKSEAVSRSAVFSGVPARVSKFAVVLGAVGAGLGAANAVAGFKKLTTVAASSAPTSRVALQAAYVMSMGVAAGVNALLVRHNYKNLQDRKKNFTKHVIVDKQGQEIGWTYNSDMAKDKLKLYQERGARVVQVQEKVDFDQVRQFLQEKDFQQVEKAG